MAVSAPYVAWKPQTPRSALRAAGDGVVLGPGVVPASTSMHESSLYFKQQRSDPEMKGLSQVQTALRKDQALQAKKYGGLEPCIHSARFHVELPRGPQHDKYSWRTYRDSTLWSPGPDSPTCCTSINGSCGKPLDQVATSRAPSKGGPRKIFAGLRFNMRTLQTWFKDIDRDESGVITQRELVVALRQKKELLAMFCQIQGVGQVYVDKSGLSAENAAALRREENYRIKEILKEVDTDNSGTMEWDEFVDFFRRAGLLLEYHTAPENNRTTLCAALEEHRIQESLEKEEAAKNNTMSRQATRPDGGLRGVLNVHLPDANDDEE